MVKLFAIFVTFFTIPFVIQCTTEKCQRRVVGFLAPSSRYKEFTESQASILTHLILHIVVVNSNNELEHAHVEEEDEDFETVNETLLLARKFPKLKVMVNIGGENGFSDTFSPTFNDSAKRNKFIQNIAKFLHDTALDGINIFWPNPVVNGIPEDRENFVLFLKELRAVFLQFPRPMVISVLTTKLYETLRIGYDFHGIAQFVDFLDSMSYGYNSPKMGARFTGPLAPIFKSRPNETDFVHKTIRTLACGSGDTQKINLGIGFYGWYWGRVSNNQLWDLDGMWLKPVANHLFDARFLRWRDIVAELDLNKSYFHEVAQTSYYHDARKGIYIGTETMESLDAKLSYADEYGLGGISISALDGDDDNETFIRKIGAWRNRACPKRQIKSFFCAQPGFTGAHLAYPVVLPPNKNWLRKLGNCCKNLTSTQSFVPQHRINCSALKAGKMPIHFGHVNSTQNRFYHAFFVQCIMGEGSVGNELERCCLANGLSDACLPMCGNATHPYMTVELMESHIMGLECAVQAQELIVICMQQKYEKQINKQKLIIRSTSLSLFILVIIIILAFIFYHYHYDAKELPVKAERMLGMGCFGAVYKAKWAGRIVAAKVLRTKCTRELVNEFKILKKLNHANICKTHSIQKVRGQLAIIMEFADLGSLDRFLQRKKPDTENSTDSLTETDLIHITLMILEGLNYLFTKNIVHRDLAARNCLVFSQHKQQSAEENMRLSVIIKLTDFGLARILKESPTYFATTSLQCVLPELAERRKSESTSALLTGAAKGDRGNGVCFGVICATSPLLPIRNAAPECITQFKYSKESDIWSFGMLLYEIFTFGNIPYGEEDVEEIKRKITEGILPKMSESISSKILMLINECCKLKPEERIGINQISEHLAGIKR